MPILGSRKRISPLDVNKNVKIGVAFPLNDQNMREGTDTIKEQVKSNLINLLLTDKGERVNEPDFGVGLRRLLFESNVDLESLKENINKQITRYIPQVSLINVNVAPTENEHKIFIIITYRFRLDGTKDAVQLNFN